MARILRFLLAASIVCLLFLRQGAFARGYGHVVPVPAEVKVSDGLYRFLEMPEIHFKRVSADVIGHEGYKMKITPRGVFVRTSSAAGEFYALQTLRQMTADGKCKELRCCEITDYPRFPYRGLHFDVSRHFRSIEFLKKQIDAMAMFKMNRMHIHLTDAAGWRFESDAYPLLTKIGAWSPAEKKNLKDFRERAAYALELLRGMGYETFDLNSEYGERKLAQTGIEHKAKGCKVSYSTPIQERYPAAGETTFTDGIIGGWTYSDRRWQGFLSDIDVTIDLGRIQNISYIGGTFMQLAGPGVFMPKKVDILVSEDGKNFRLAATVWNDVSVKNTDLLFRSFDTVLDEDIRYVRYHAYRSTMRGFLFLDEIVVN